MDNTTINNNKGKMQLLRILINKTSHKKNFFLLYY